MLLVCFSGWNQSDAVNNVLFAPSTVWSSPCQVLQSRRWAVQLGEEPAPWFEKYKSQGPCTGRWITCHCGVRPQPKRRLKWTLGSVAEDCTGNNLLFLPLFHRDGDPLPQGWRPTSIGWRPSSTGVETLFHRVETLFCRVVDHLP